MVYYRLPPTFNLINSVTLELTKTNKTQDVLKWVICFRSI